jgi:hypothetical protein
MDCTILNILASHLQHNGLCYAVQLLYHTLQYKGRRLAENHHYLITVPTELPAVIQPIASVSTHKPHCLQIPLLSKPICMNLNPHILLHFHSFILWHSSNIISTLCSTATLTVTLTQLEVSLRSRCIQIFRSPDGLFCGVLLFAEW